MGESIKDRLSALSRRELAGLRAVPTASTWSFPAPPHIAHTKFITFDPKDSRTIYACIEQGALLKSIDGRVELLFLFALVLPVRVHGETKRVFPLVPVVDLSVGAAGTGNHEARSGRPIPRRP